MTFLQINILQIIIQQHKSATQQVQKCIVQPGT